MRLSFAVWGVETTWGPERRNEPVKSATKNSYSLEKLVEINWDRVRCERQTKK